ncbi:hypothetical protein [Pantoea vagans]|uniref:hypothetical protein n=1 Tax=Pantoea vagans TaxID=470934 RepID=UPI0028A1BBED|nr:hypothetical protein [Pantoea vagans]
MQLIISTATATQVFILREQSMHATIAGKEIDHVTLKGGANLQTDSLSDAATGKRIALRDNGEFSTTLVTDEQFEWLQQESGYQQMVKNGYLRAVYLSDKEAAAMKPHHFDLEGEAQLDNMSTGGDGGRQLTDADFVNSLAKVKGTGR